jgi:hypothetical protein
MYCEGNVTHGRRFAFFVWGTRPAIADCSARALPPATRLRRLSSVMNARRF